MKVTLPKTIDRSFVKMMATKRIISGSLSIAGAIAILGIVLFSTHAHEAKTLTALALALVLLGGGGAWSLYDGIRLWKMLRASVSSG